MESRKHLTRGVSYNRLLLIAVMLMAATSLLAKGSIQQGIAYLYDYKTQTKKPIANVKLTVAGAEPTESREDGTFTLIFNSYGIGDKITNSNQPYYQGLKVFNKKEVDNWYIVKGRIRLIMCKYEEFELAKSNYYQLGMKAAKNKYDKQIAQIKANHKLKEAEMRQQLQQAEENYQLAMEKMSESSEGMARIDQSELDATMREILNMYSRGDVKEALEKLNTLNLKEKFEQVLDIKHENEKKIEQDKQDSIAVLNNIRSSIEIYKNYNDFEKACEYLKLLADKLNTPEDIFGYASFCQDQNMFADGISYYNKALLLYRRLSAANISAYEPIVAATLCRMAGLYIVTWRDSDAQSLLQEARSIAEKYPSMGIDLIKNN